MVNANVLIVGAVDGIFEAPTDRILESAKNLTLEGPTDGKL